MVRRVAAVMLVVLATAAGLAATRLVIDNRLEIWLDADRDEERRYGEFRGLFGSDEFMVAAVSGDDVFSPSMLDRMVTAAERMESVPGVTRVDGLPVVYRDLFGAEDSDELLDEATSTPFYGGLFVSPDAETVGLLMEVAPGQAPDDRARIVDEVHSFCAEATLSVSLWGEPAYHSEFADLAAAVLERDLRLVVETSGVGWQEEVFSGLAELSAGKKPAALDWIVSLDRP